MQLLHLPATQAASWCGFVRKCEGERERERERENSRNNVSDQRLITDEKRGKERESRSGQRAKRDVRRRRACFPLVQHPNLQRLATSLSPRRKDGQRSRREGHAGGCGDMGISLPPDPSAERYFALGVAPAGGYAGEGGDAAGDAQVVAAAAVAAAAAARQVALCTGQCLRWHAGPQ